MFLQTFTGVFRKSFCARAVSLRWRKPENNGNWTEWSAIWPEIICVIWNHKYDFRQKLHDTRFHFLLHLFWNRPNTGLGQVLYFIYAVLSPFEIKFIHFWGGKNKSFGNISSKICFTIRFVYHFPAIWLVTLNKPWNLIGCFVFSVASSLAGKKMQFKAKNGAIRE